MTTTLPASPIARGKLGMIRDEIEYYQHQVDGVRWLYPIPRFILGDDMGLGKTLESLTVAACDFEQGRAARVIVVCPLSLKGNWVDEIEAFTHFSYHVLTGSPAARRAQLKAFKEDILIVNYEQVVAHVDTLKMMLFDIAIYDEAHYIKGYTSKRSRACRNMVTPRTMLLTGSPMLNHVDDLWALLHMIAPTEYPSYHSFLNRYGIFGGWKDKKIIGVKNPDELNDRVNGVMLRRLKKDVLGLPDKLYVRLSVDMTPLQKKLYDQATDEMLIELPDDPNPMELENALTKMLRLKQICGTTACIPGHDDSSGKLDLAVERIKMLVENGERVVVFTQFRDVLRCLTDRLRAEDVPLYKLHGDVKAEQRQPLINVWSSSSAKPGALCCMLQVAGVGLNMTAASTAIFLDKLWSPKLNEQAEDRLHRIGASETEPVTIISIACRGAAVEQRVEKILGAKSKTFTTVVERDDWKIRLLESLKKKEPIAA